MSVSEDDGRKKSSRGKRTEKQRQDQSAPPRNVKNTAPANLKFGVTDDVPGFGKLYDVEPTPARN